MAAHETPMPVYWDLPHASQRQPVVGRAMVSTSQPLAAQAGLAALRAGGNAVDAALAAAIALTVVEPVSNGVGGDLFALVWDPASPQPVLGLNASGRSPAAWSSAACQARFAAMSAMPLTGWDSVTVPGGVAGWWWLSDRLGCLPFAALFRDAIAYAEDGFVVSPVVARKWAKEAQRLREAPDFVAHFLHQGQAPRAGSLFRTPHVGATLREIADSKAQSFYCGELARAICAHARVRGGALTLEDLARQWDEPGWMTPIRQDYRGYDVYQLPPNGQGITTLQALGILAHFDSGVLGSASPAAQHLMIEALKLAFVDTYSVIGDPCSMDADVAAMLSPARLAAQAERIDPQRAGDFGPAIPPWGGTVYVAAADASGMMVSLIQSNFLGVGSGIVVPGTGISLHNRAACFSLDRQHPNRVDGSKRPFHTIIPALVAKDAAPWGVLGVTGGPIQPQGQVQLLAGLIDGRGNPQAVVDAPRWKLEHNSLGLQLDIEPGYPEQAASALRAMGHPGGPPGITGTDFGGGFVITRSPASDGEPPLWVGGADPRRDGLVAAM